MSAALEGTLTPLALPGLGRPPPDFSRGFHSVPPAGAELVHSEGRLSYWSDGVLRAVPRDRWVLGRWGLAPDAWELMLRVARSVYWGVFERWDELARIERVCERELLAASSPGMKRLRCERLGVELVDGGRETLFVWSRTRQGEREEYVTVTRALDESLLALVTPPPPALEWDECALHGAARNRGMRYLTLVPGQHAMLLHERDTLEPIDALARDFIVHEVLTGAPRGVALPRVGDWPYAPGLHLSEVLGALLQLFELPALRLEADGDAVLVHGGEDGAPGRFVSMPQLLWMLEDLQQAQRAARAAAEAAARG